MDGEGGWRMKKRNRKKIANLILRENKLFLIKSRNKYSNNLDLIN